VFSILIVEDDATKADRIIMALKRVGVGAGDISHMKSSNQAKQWLRSRTADLMVLDLNIPRHLDEMPVKDEGVRMLEEISARPQFTKPAHVIGLTQYEDIYLEAAPIFNDALISILLYDRADDAWEHKFLRKVEYLISTKLVTNSTGDYDFDLAIITATERPELEAVLKLDWNWQPLVPDNDDTTYYTGVIRSNSEPVRAIAAAAPFMGMPAAAAVAMKVIERYKPRYLIHCGITAGIRGRADFGDVIVADPSWDWGSGKFASKDGKVAFFAAPYQILLREEIRGKIRRLIGAEELLARIRAEWPGAKPNTALKVILGPSASGASVLSDGHTALQIEDQHRKIVGIEMEAYGVLAAAEFCARPRPLAVAMKAVSDFADPGKDDNFHAYASYTSARCMQVFAEQFLFPQR
jgi:nucleoside phosphorylase/CheY-like chemotaxis protein